MEENTSVLKETEIVSKIFFTSSVTLPDDFEKLWRRLMLSTMGEIIETFGDTKFQWKMDKIV